MNHFLRKIWSKLVPSTSEQANQNQLLTKHQPYSDAYFFTHVPKTGGTSFIVFLDRFFPAKVIFPHQLWIEVGDFSAIDKKAFHLIRGHFGGGAIDLITDKNVKFLTILRDPVKLAYSTYEFVKRETGTALHPLVVKENMSFETFLEHPKTKHLVTDRMVHNLVYGHEYDSALNQMVLNEESFPQFRKGMNKGLKALNAQQRLSMSKAFLDQCLWFGILEDFNHAVRLLCYKMAWPPLGKSQKLNINKNRPVITDQARTKALALNKLDSQLYDYAKEQFNQQVKEMYQALGCDLTDEEEKLDAAIDRHYQQHYRNKYKLPLQTSVSYDFSEILLGNQWHRREWDALHKKYFRWTGPGNQSYLDFWVASQNYEIKVQVIDAIDTVVLDKLKVYVNDHEVAVNAQEKNKKRLLIIDCPESHIAKNGLLRLQFHCEQVKQHKVIFGADDSRLVGLAIESIVIEKK